MRVFEVQWSWALSLVCEVTLTTKLEEIAWPHRGVEPAPSQLGRCPPHPPESGPPIQQGCDKLPSNTGWLDVGWKRNIQPSSAGWADPKTGIYCIHPTFKLGPYTFMINSSLMTCTTLTPRFQKVNSGVNPSRTRQNKIYVGCILFQGCPLSTKQASSAHVE